MQNLLPNFVIPESSCERLGHFLGKDSDIECQSFQELISSSYPQSSIYVCKQHVIIW